jgi:iron complex outermembrane recepter protein
MSTRVNGIKRTELSGRTGLWTLCVPLLVLGAAFGQSAAAQTAAADQNTTAQSTATTGTLQEVVVTAERRATNLQTTPISVVAVSGSQLQSQQINDITNLGQVTPNLVVYTTGTNSTADIRGVGNSNQGGIEQPGVLVVRDGLPNNTEGAGESIPNFDIADVEVLRGPQGTFAGDNSTGGAIVITTANPNFRGINGYIDLQGATYSDQKAQGAVNIPITDSFAMRVAFNEETRGSFFRDTNSLINGPNQAGPYLCQGAPPCLGTTGIGPTYPVSGSKALADPGNVDNKNVRVGLLWQPTQAWQSLTKIEFDRMDSDGVPTQPNIYGFAPLGPGLPCPAGEGTAPNCHDTYAPGYSGQPFVRNDWASQLTRFNDHVNVLGEQLQYTLSGGTQLRLTAGDQEIQQVSVSSTSHDTLAVGSLGQGVNTFHVYSGEFDALSPTTGKFSWIAGAAYDYTSYQYTANNIITTPPFSIATPAHFFFTDGENIWQISQGIFGQISWQFAPTLQLVAGARMGWDSEVALGGLALWSPFFVNVNSNQPIGGPPSDRVPTGKIDLNWTPLPGQFFYAFFARGYKPGEENLGVEKPAGKETVNDYEIGWKGRLADGHVLTQLGGYYMQYYNMIYGIFDPQIPRATNDSNIPYSHLEGIEFSMQSRVGGLGLNISAAYNKSVLGPLTTAATFKFPSGFTNLVQCTPSQIGTAAEGTTCNNFLPYEVHLGGEGLPYSPKFTTHVDLQYAIPLGDSELTPRVTYSYQSKTYSSIFQSDPYFELPSYSLVSAYLDWSIGTWTTTLWATNVANTLYLQGTGLYGAPRQLGIEAHKTF